MSDWDAVLALAEGKEPEGEHCPRPSKKARTVVPSRLALPSDPSLLKHENTLASSWDGTKCSKYRAGHGRTCDSCGQAKNAHVLLVPSPSSQALVAYCTLRNVRCCLMLQVDIRSRDRKALQRICKKKKNSVYPLEVVTESQTLLDLLSETSPDRKRMIIACDAAYNQLYYWDLTSRDHRLGDDEVEDANVVPPPMVYFSESEPMEDRALPNPPAEFAPNSMEQKRWLALNELFGLSKVSKPTHVLEALHRARMRETYSVLECSDSPSLVQDWRDSCRDFLCHLYAYATLSSELLQELKIVLQGSQRVVEVGAGTGYISHLLEHALPITAYDYSTDGNNEYHARTPHFTAVKVGDAAKVDLGDALILCYPPTDNNMAEVALNRFRTTATGGASDRVLIHIGEFKGLTGTRAFERLLLQHFTCTKRWPCRTWGTDASEVTVWKTRNSCNMEQSLLVPCSWCGAAESKRRSKILRCLSYCSEVCFLKDSPIHQPFLLQEMPLEYTADKHSFQELVI